MDADSYPSLKMRYRVMLLIAKQVGGAHTPHESHTRTR